MIICSLGEVLQFVDEVGALCFKEWEGVYIDLDMPGASDVQEEFKEIACNKDKAPMQLVALRCRCLLWIGVF